MYKEYNHKYDSLIHFEGVTNVPSSTKQGTIVEYNQIVSHVQFFNSVDGVSFNKIILSRDFIIDLHNHIKEIESKKFFREYDNLPF